MTVPANGRKELLEQYGRFYGEQRFAVAFTASNQGEDAKRVIAKGWDRSAPLSTADFAAGLIGGRGMSRNVAIVLRPSNLIVLECDTAEDLTRINSLKLPATLTVQSSAPYKRHFYFRPPAELEALPYVAFRFESGKLTADTGRYFLAPPSIHPSGAVYAFLAGLGPTDLPIAELPASVYKELAEQARVEDTSLREAIELDPETKIRAGNRRDFLFRYACMLRRWGHSRQDILAATLAFNQVRCDPPVEASLVETQVDGAMKKHGGQEIVAATNGTAPPSEDATAPPAFRITVYSARELAEMQLPQGAEPLAGPFVRRGMITLLAGITGHGKTTFIAQTVKAAAEGGTLIGNDVAGGSRVLILDLEQHLASIQRIVNDTGLRNTDRVDYAPIPEGLALDKRSDQLDEVRRILAAKEYDIVVLDPFYKLHEADSSDELQARLLVALLRGWIKEYGFSILTATHCRKLPAGRNHVILDDLFGSSLFTRDPELVLAIQRYNALTKLQVLKSREPPLEYGQTFELLYHRERGFYEKPTKTTEETERDLRKDIDKVVAEVTRKPGASKNALEKACGWGGSKTVKVLKEAAKRKLLSGPYKGTGGAHTYFPLNHAGLPSSDQLVMEDSEPQNQPDTESTSSGFPLPSIGREDREEGKTATPHDDEPAPFDHADDDIDWGVK